MKKLLAFLFLFLVVGVASFVYVQPSPRVLETIMSLSGSNDPRNTVVLLKGNRGGICSAVVIGPGQLLTAAHCVGEDYVAYKGYKVPFTIKYKNPRQDLAFLEAVGVECPCSPILFEEPKQDETVYKYGYALYPSTRMLNRTLGEYQGTIVMEEGQKWMLSTAPAAPGDSGGGVFVRRWGTYYLVGITVAIATLNTGLFPQPVFFLSLAVPTSILRP